MLPLVLLAMSFLLVSVIIFVFMLFLYLTVAKVNNSALFCKADTDTAINYVVVVVNGITIFVFSDCL